MNIKLYLDEDIDTRLVPAVKFLGFDVISVAETDRRGLSDEEQLSYASDQGRTILTHNTAHYAQINKRWLREGKSHCGIIVAPQWPFKAILACLRNLLSLLDAEDMLNHIEYLSNWK
ncbi:MAG: DUF5615 family PIN-like protein [Candidatus Latescibacteria bacterium]|nr:DUF5615 family PIN-like protein [Candidatus Latescibacterota bacterium]